MSRIPMIVIALLGLGACVSPQQPEVTSKALMELARKAKAEGKRSVSTGLEVDMMSPGSLQEALSKTSIAIVIPTGLPRVLVDGDWIRTAQDLRVEHWLRRVPVDARACKQRWPGVASDERLMTTRLVKGTVVVDGVSITEETQSKVDLVTGQRYLALVQDCPGRRLEATYWSDSFLVLTDAGAITVPPFNQHPMPFVGEIVSMDNVAALEDVIRRLP